MTVIMSVMAVVDTGTTRERLVAAAIEVFVEQGYENARVQDIARAAGLTTGAIYANYRGKTELLLDAITARADAEMDALLHDATGHETRELLGILGDRLVQRRSRIALLLDAIAASRRDPQLAMLLRERLGEREQLVGALIDQGKGSGTVDPGVDTDVFARFCVMLSLGALAMRALAVDPPELGDWHSLIARLLDACGPEE
jgi:AcrR family transcriptional regulator